MELAYQILMDPVVLEVDEPNLTQCVVQLFSYAVQGALARLSLVMQPCNQVTLTAIPF